MALTRSCTPFFMVLGVIAKRRSSWQSDEKNFGNALLGCCFGPAWRSSLPPWPFEARAWILRSLPTWRQVKARRLAAPTNPAQQSPPARSNSTPGEAANKAPAASRNAPAELPPAATSPAPRLSPLNNRCLADSRRCSFPAPDRTVTRWTVWRQRPKSSAISTCPAEDLSEQQ